MERKEAIEVIKKNYPDSNFTMLREALETLIPELKENEDEKIREWLISQLKIKSDDTNSDLNIMINKAISWLEKRGGRNLADGTFVNVDDVREDFVQEVYRVLDADSTNDRVNQIIDAFDNLPTVTIEVLNGEKVDNANKVEQKPAWSEEDLYKIKHALFGTYAVDTATRLLNKIKSFKLQNTWKPSDEQIKAVKEAACYSSVFSEKTIDNLIQLSKQLKEIMGE